MEQLIITVVSLCLFPVIGLLFLVVILASFGKSLGIRKRYVNLLLRIFEFGKTKIAHYESKRLTEPCDSEECVSTKLALNGEIARYSKGICQPCTADHSLFTFV
ncbi:uncharacterized protein LOC121382883 [Gigantopelta aegis]|uniref:uncharacterized protein LOC121382883 n=1 Tax=Gigantopelta aegis TaxID=1735272 RepID=UPI001B8889DC|nr:uncharacterized protein LOC121382883 [Gigantopelta aegis]